MDMLSCIVYGYVIMHTAYVMDMLSCICYGYVIMHMLWICSGYVMDMLWN